MCTCRCTDGREASDQLSICFKFRHCLRQPDKLRQMEWASNYLSWLKYLALHLRTQFADWTCISPLPDHGIQFEPAEGRNCSKIHSRQRSQEDLLRKKTDRCGSTFNLINTCLHHKHAEWQRHRHLASVNNRHLLHPRDWPSLWQSGSRKLPMVYTPLTRHHLSWQCQEKNSAEATTLYKLLDLVETTMDVTPDVTVICCGCLLYTSDAADE